jgi:dihydrofolate reductase
MLEVVYYVASSLDGYIASADGSVDWLKPFQARGEDHGASDLHASVDALLLGSHTYEFALQLGQWPASDKPSWVFTGRDLRVLHPSITITRQSPVEVIALLASRGYRRVWLMGGGKLAASFHAEQLISRYMISVFPVLLGSGIPLLAPHACLPDTLRLISSAPFKSGIVQLTYEPHTTPNHATQPTGGRRTASRFND